MNQRQSMWHGWRSRRVRLCGIISRGLIGFLRGGLKRRFLSFVRDIKAKFGVNLVSFHLVVWVGNEEGDKDTQQRAQTEEDIRESVKLYPEVELDVPAGELTQEIAQYVRNRVIEAGENPPKVAEVIEKMRQSFMLI